MNDTVLVLGDIMTDVVVRLEGPIRRGTDRRATIRRHAGGSGANQAAWLAYCGVPVRLLACVGAADRAAERAGLAAQGVATCLVAHPGLPTGQLIALVDPDGERSFLTDRGANDALALPALPSDLFDAVGHLHVSGYACVGPETRATARFLIGEARRRGLPVSFDPGSAGFVTELGAPLVLDWAAGATLCVANQDEALALTGSPDPQGQLQALNAHFELAVLKRGAAGAQARHRDDRRWEASAPAVPVIDTIGAGDAFLAGFLAGILAGRDIETALARAVLRGSQAVGLSGGRPPRPRPGRD